MNYKVIYPELGDKPNATIEFIVSIRGGYYVTTDLELKGKGIKQVGDGSTHARKKKTYNVTLRAMELLTKKHDCCYTAIL